MVDTQRPAPRSGVGGERQPQPGFLPRRPAEGWPGLYRRTGDEGRTWAVAGPLGKLCSADPDAQGVQQDDEHTHGRHCLKGALPHLERPPGRLQQHDQDGAQAGLRIQGHPILLPQDLGQEQEIPQEPLNRKSQGETDSV